MSAPQPLPSRSDTAPQVCAHCGCYSSAVMHSEDALCIDCEARCCDRYLIWDMGLESGLPAELSAPPAASPRRQPPPPLPTKATEAGTPPARLLDACLLLDPTPVTWRQRLVYALGVPALLTLVGLVVIGLGAGVTVFLGNLPR